MYVFVFVLSLSSPPCSHLCFPLPFHTLPQRDATCSNSRPWKSFPHPWPQGETERERRRRRRKSRDVLPCQITAERSWGKFPPASGGGGGGGGGEMLLLLLSGIILQRGRAKVSDPRLVIHSRKIFGSLFACASNRIACRGRLSLPFLLFRKSGCLRLQKRRFSCME